MARRRRSRKSFHKKSMGMAKLAGLGALAISFMNQINSKDAPLNASALASPFSQFAYQVSNVIARVSGGAVNLMPAQIPKYSPTFNLNGVNNVYTQAGLVGTVLSEWHVTKKYVPSVLRKIFKGALLGGAVGGILDAPGASSAARAGGGLAISSGAASAGIRASSIGANSIF